MMAERRLNPIVIPIAAAAIQDERANDPKKAEAYYRRALAKDPNLWMVQNNLAMLLLQNSGDLQEARAHAAEAVKSSPRTATVYDTLASVQAKANDAKGAAESMQTAAKLEPDNAVWRIFLAQYLLDSGDLPAATKVVTAIDTERLELTSLRPDVRKRLDGIRQQLRGKGR